MTVADNIGYPFQTVNHDASIEVCMEAADLDAVPISIQVGDVADVHLDLDLDAALGLASAIHAKVREIAPEFWEVMSGLGRLADLIETCVPGDEATRRGCADLVRSEAARVGGQ